MRNVLPSILRSSIRMFGLEQALPVQLTPQVDVVVRLVIVSAVGSVRQAVVVPAAEVTWILKADGMGKEVTLSVLAQPHHWAARNVNPTLSRVVAPIGRHRLSMQGLT